MKTYKNKLLLSAGFFLLSLAALVGLGSGSALAATKTWDGGGTDSNFSTAENWSDDTAPVDGDSIVLPLDVIFSGCPDDVVLNNDLNSASMTLAGLSATGERPEDCYGSLTISGNIIKSSGDIDISIPLVIDGGVEAVGAITLANVSSSGMLNIGNHNVSIVGSAFKGGASGSGVLTIQYASAGKGGGCDPVQASPSPIAGDSSAFSGSIVLEGGFITITARADDIARHASSITSNDGGIIRFTLDYGSDMTFRDTPITINSGTIYVNQNSNGCTNAPSSNKKVTVNSDVTIAAKTDVYLTNADIHFGGKVTGKQYIKAADGQTGSISFADGSTIESAVRKVKIDSIEDCGSIWSASSKNTLTIINADCTKSEYNKFDNPEFPLEIRGIVSGTGKIGHVKVMSGGVIAPGLSPGTLTVASIEWEEGGVYEFEIGKSAADQIKSLGTVKLGDGTLKAVLLDGVKPAAGKQYVIISNDGKGKTQGTFKDLPEGATFEADGYVFQISYKGGDGNDVVLTVKDIPKAPKTGFGMIANNPLLTLAITSGAAGSMLVIAKRRRKLAKSS